MIQFPQLYRRLNRKMSSVQKRLFARQLRKDTGTHTIRNTDEPSVAIQKAQLHLSKPRTAKRKSSRIHPTKRSSSIQRSARYRQRRHSRVNTTRQLVNLIAMALVVAGCSWLMPKSGSSSGSSSGYNRLVSQDKPQITFYKSTYNSNNTPRAIMQMANTFRNDTFVKQSGNAYCLMYAVNNAIHPLGPATVAEFDAIQQQLAQNAGDVYYGPNLSDVEPEQGGNYNLDVMRMYFDQNNINHYTYVPQDKDQIHTTLRDKGILGFIMHTGTNTGGHYVALKHLSDSNDNWYIFADSLGIIMLIKTDDVAEFIESQNYTTIICVSTT